MVGVDRIFHGSMDETERRGLKDEISSGFLFVTEEAKKRRRRKKKIVINLGADSIGLTLESF